MNWKLVAWLALTIAALVACWHRPSEAQQQRPPEGRLIGSYRGGEVWRVQDRGANCYVVVNTDGKAAGISCVGGAR